MTKLGRCFFGTAVAASGIQQLVTGAFVRLVPVSPAWIPWPSVWARLTGMLLIAIGLALIAEYKARLAATALAALLVLLLLFVQLPLATTNPWAGFMWTNPWKVLALLGGVFLVLLIPERLRIAAPWLLGGFLLICGVQHFVYAEFVIELVPAWLPRRDLWTYFTGLALIAGGVGVVIPRTRRLAASLSGLMIAMWVVLLHIPRALADLHVAGEMSGVFEALALSGVALLLAGTTKTR